VKVPGLGAFRDLRARFGSGAAVQHALHRFINTLMYFEWMHIIVLDRENLRPLREDPRLDVRPVKLASYTWAHTQGRPELIPRR